MVSHGYSPPRGRSPTCYSPVRHFPPNASIGFLVRLACVKHAASVHPEPGSNSPYNYFQVESPSTFILNGLSLSLSVSCHSLVVKVRLDKKKRHPPCECRPKHQSSSSIVDISSALRGLFSFYCQSNFPHFVDEFFLQREDILPHPSRSVKSLDTLFIPFILRQQEDFTTSLYLCQDLLLTFKFFESTSTTSHYDHSTPDSA